MKPGLRLQILVFSLIRIVYNTMHRMVYPYLGQFGQGLGVGLPELSQAFALRSLVGSFSPFLAFLADSRGRRFGMLLGLALIALASVALAVLPVFSIFILGLVLSTVGYFIFVPSMQAYLGDEVPYRQRGLVLAVTEFGWSLSFILGVPVVGFLIAQYGWSSPFPVLALLAVLSLVSLARLLPASAQMAVASSGILNQLRSILISPAAWAGLMLSVMMTTANESVNLVFGLWLNDAFGLQVTTLGLMAIGIGLAEFGGEALVGGLVDRLGKMPSIAAGLGLNGLAALALIFTGGNQSGAIAALVVFYMTFEFTLVSSLPLMTEILPGARASLMAVNIAMFSLGRAIGAGLGGWLYTLSPDHIPAISANAAAAVGFNLVALLALGLLRRWWGPETGR
jgi:MFS transporter, DHA1 family, inner membrane transport protein